MVAIILTLAFMFLSIGIYTRLAKFGAPVSAVFYAGFIPFSVFLFNIILGFKYIKDQKDTRGISNIYNWIIFEFCAAKRFSLVNTLFIVKIGSMKLTVLDFINAMNKFYSNIFVKVKVYIEQQVKAVFNCSYEDMLMKGNAFNL